MNTRITGQYTRGFDGQIAQRPQSNLMAAPGVDPAMMMYQRPMMLRDQGRQVPQLSFGGKIRTMENPVVTANLALHNVTPDAVLKSRDLRATVTQQNDSLSERNSKAMMDSLAPAPFRTTPGTTDPRVLMGYISQQGPADPMGLRSVKRTDREVSALEARHTQDGITVRALGMDPAATSELRMPPSARALFVTQSFGRSYDEQASRSDAMYNRVFTSSLPVDDPRLLSSPLGAGVVKHVSGTAAPHPMNSRR